MPYEAKSNGNGTYTVMDQGAPVPGAVVKSISFPTINSHTIDGIIHHIAGACVATISVPGIGVINNVPVIF